MEKLSDLITGRLATHQLSESAQSAIIIFYANRFLMNRYQGKNSEIKAYRYEKGTLSISAPNSVMSQEIWGFQQKMLEEVNRFCEGRIKRIRIKNLTFK